MTNKIRKFIPVGIKSENEAWIFLSLISVGTARALLFFYNYKIQYNNLFEFVYGEKILRPTTRIADFYEIINGCFDGFIVAFFAFICLTIYHYAYHYKDSKSIYTMKRLPRRSELHIRCLTVPLAGIIFCLILASCLLLIFYNFYITKTPPECLYPDQWERLWTEILYGGKTL